MQPYDRSGTAPGTGTDARTQQTDTRPSEADARPTEGGEMRAAAGGDALAPDEADTHRPAGSDARRDGQAPGQAPGDAPGEAAGDAHGEAPGLPPAAADARRPDEAAIRRYLVEQIALRARISAAEVDTDRPLEEFGLASRDAVAIAGELEQILDRSLPATLVWEHPTINRLSVALAHPDRVASGPATGPAAATAAAAQRPVVDEPIAVIGLGCRFPGGEAAPGGITDPAAYWSFLLDGGDAIREVSADRWAPFDDGSPEVADLLEKTTRLGGFLDGIDQFDAEFFGITPREAAVMDPQQRLVLEVAWEAFEHAGLAPARLRGSRTGVFVGVSAPEYAAFTAADLAALEPFTATGAALSIIANRLSYLLDLRGPSMIVDTACSSSLVATHLAVRALREGDADVALAGGVNILLSPTITMTFDQGGATAADGHCKAFDASADGMVRAEGCGAVVLKRLSDALRDGDRVLAVIKGSGVNSDGRSNGLVAPNADAQRQLLGEVYATAGIGPHEVDYVEAHGTGTFLGDPIEAGALGSVLGAGRAAEAPLLIGSVKSNLGHMESAAGIAGLIKTVLALHHRTLPPSLHFKEPNPHIPFEDLRLAVVSEETPWPDRGHPARAGVSAFGFGGTNAHVVLEEAPRLAAPARPASVRIYPVSDTNADRVRDHAAALASWLTGAEDVLDADVERTLQRRNGRGRSRAAVVARDRDGLLDGLRALADGRPHPAVVTGSALGVPGRPVWVFSGYGAQRAGMAQRLLEEEAPFAEAIDDLDALFAEEAGFSLWDLLESGRMPEELVETMPALFGIQIGLARMWAAYGVVPGAVIGHSMGEVAAAVVAGALTLADGVKVITRRSKLLTSLIGNGQMAVLGCSADEARRLAHDLPEVYTAVHSSPRQTVITGDVGQIAIALERAEAEGLLARRVQAQGAGHSPQVDPLLPRLREQLADIGAERGTPLAEGIRLYTTALDDPRGAGGDATLDAEYWAANLRNPVRLTDAVAAAAEDGYRAFVEINAHPILSHAVGETLEDSGGGALVAHSLKRAPKGQETDDTLTFHTQLATLLVHDYSVTTPPGALLDLPRSPWRHERHWIETGRTVGKDEHPLLGAHVELPGEDRHAWRADVGLGALPWLTGARVHGLAVLPTAALAEMALAAGAEALGTETVRLYGLCVERPHALGVEAIVTTTFSEVDQRVEIHARNPAGTWTRLAYAEVAEDLGDAGREAPRVLTGPATQVGGAERGSRHYRLHPEVFDRCLGLLSSENADGVQVPTAIGSLRVYGPTHRGGYCRTEFTPGPDGRPLGSVQLLSQEGEVLAEAIDVSLQPVTAQDLPVPLEDKLIEIVWPETPLPALAASAEVAEVAEGAEVASSAEGGARARRWVIMAVERDLMADAVADELTGLGHQVVRSPLLLDPVPAELPVADTAGVIFFPPRDLKDERLVLAVVGLSRALARLDAVPRLWIATKCVQPIPAGVKGQPQHAFVSALTRVLAFEHPALRATVADVESAADLVAELLADATDTEVVWRDGVRHAARLAAATLHPDDRPATGVAHSDGSPDPVLGAIAVARTGDGAARTGSAAAHGRDGAARDVGGAARGRDSLARDVGGAARGRGGAARDVGGAARDRAGAARDGAGAARTKRRVVRRGGAYIITGGYGGLGLVTAKLLAERGAGRLVLSGRSGPGPDAEKAITALRESGVDVNVVLGDIAEPGVAERLVAVARYGESGSGRPVTRLCGVVHGAGLLDDRLIADLGPEDLHRVWGPKVDGAWRLSQVTWDLDLDWFVLQSSAAALLGSPGQAAYAAANAAIDAFAAYRRAHGRPATTIGWGPWSQVGGAADLGIRVLDPITPDEGAEALEALIAAGRPATGVIRFDPATAVSMFPELVRMPYFAALIEAAAGPETDDDDWPGADALRELDPATARRMIADRVRHRIATVLGFDPARLDPATPLTDLGLDSLVAVRIKSAVEHDLGLTVPPSILLQGASVDAFEDWAAGELGLDTAPKPAAVGAAGAVSNAEEGYVMPRDAAERLAVRLFEDVLGLDRVSVTADFFELGGQEHQADQVVAQVVAELGGELTRTELFRVPTAEHVAEVIRAADEEAARQTVRLLKPGRGDRAPIFIAHPAGGTTVCYQQLTGLLGADQPVYGLERFADAPSVEERAGRYVEHLLEMRPSGPFRLGGWSFGGVLAYETARQLTSRGHEVELVALFDAGLPLPVEDESDTLARRFSAFADYLNVTYGLDITLTYEELAGLTEDEQFALVMERAAPLVDHIPPAALTHQLTSHQDTRSLEAYQPGPYDGRVVLYKAPEETPWAVRDARYVLNETNGFGGLCPNLEIVTIPGVHHLNLLDPPGVGVLAAHLAAELSHPGR